MLFFFTALETQLKSGLVLEWLIHKWDPNFVVEDTDNLGSGQWSLFYYIYLFFLLMFVFILQPVLFIYLFSICVPGL